MAARHRADVAACLTDRSVAYTVLDGNRVAKHAISTGSASIDEQECDVEAAIGFRCSSVAGRQCPTMLHGGCADEGVVHRSAGNAERAESDQQRAWRVVT